MHVNMILTTIKFNVDHSEITAQFYTRHHVIHMNTSILLCE